MAELRDQMDALKETDWQTLIILDACRADYYQVETGKDGPEMMVRSPASHTKPWVKIALSEGIFDGAVLISASVMVSYMLKREGGVKRLGAFLELWQEHWGGYDRYAFPTVMPQIVRRATGNYIAEKGWPDKMILWFEQPHIPYVGEPTLKIPSTVRVHVAGRTERVEKVKTDWPNQKLLRREYRNGRLGIRRVIDSYVGNLRLVRKQVEPLLANLKGRAIITADHGELLGEDGLIGHDPRWSNDALYIVPWDEREGGGTMPEWEPFTEDFAQPSVREKLEHLGYA